MRKFLTLSLVFVMLLGLAGMAAASEPGKLLIWADENRLEVIKDLEKDFEDEYGVPVEVQEKPFGDIRDSMRVEAPSGEGPDVIIGAHDWIGELVNNGLITAIDLSDLEDKFIDASIDAFTWEGKVYALPYAIESIGLVYNKDLVPTPPETWEEFVKIVDEHTNEEQEKYGFAMPQPDPFHTYPFFTALGGYVFKVNEDGTYDTNDIGLNNEGAVEGIKMLNELYKKHAPYVDSQTMTSLFTSGDLAMMVTGPWSFSSLDSVDMNYGFAPFPKMKGERPEPFSSVHGFMISAFSENKMLAQAFLREFVATEEVMTKLYEEGTRPPTYKPAINNMEEGSLMKGVLESARASQPMPNIPEMGAVWSAWSDALEVILNQKQDVKPALDNAVEQIKTSLEKSSN